MFRPIYDLFEPTADTASASIIVTMFEVVRPIKAGPYPVFATDSVVQTLTFVGIGSVPPPDTFHLKLAKPALGP